MITRNSRVSLLLGGSVVVVVIQRRRDHSIATTPRERERERRLKSRRENEEVPSLKLGKYSLSWDDDRTHTPSLIVPSRRRWV